MFVGEVLACNQIQRRQSGGAGTCRELTFHTVKAKGGLVLLGLMQLRIKLCLSEKTLGLSCGLFIFLVFIFGTGCLYLSQFKCLLMNQWTNA